MSGAILIVSTAVLVFGFLRVIGNRSPDVVRSAVHSTAERDRGRAEKCRHGCDAPRRANPRARRKPSHATPVGVGGSTQADTAINLKDPTAQIDPRTFTIVFGIVTKSDEELQLSFLSRFTLRNAWLRLRTDPKI